jgi:1-deoxyxylulose-5-phosphate synthase
MDKLTRRTFFKATVAASVVAGSAPAIPAAPVKRTATDWVPLGKSGVKVTRLALGTGTKGGKIQRELGQEAFTKIVRHAYDRGIRFFETADAYTGMPVMLSTALKGIPRDSYKLMTKYRARQGDDVYATLDRFRKELNSDYFDILLIHCVRTADWPEQLKALQDTFSEAKQKKLLLAHGASCHGLLPLRRFPETKWLDVALMRLNHEGTLMDNIKEGAREKGDVTEVFSHVKKIHANGTGVLGMKIFGEGQFTNAEDRDASLKFVLKSGDVDAFTIGFKNTDEVDEAIDRINRQLNA